MRATKKEFDEYNKCYPYLVKKANGTPCHPYKLIKNTPSEIVEIFKTSSCFNFEETDSWVHALFKDNL